MALMANFDVAGSALAAESMRLNLTASNIANANTTMGSWEEAYRARLPVFRTDYVGAHKAVGVKLAGIVQNAKEPAARYEPDNPIADEDGYVYGSNVNAVEEMVNMIAASRNYQSNVRVMETTKQLLMRTLTLGE